MEYKPRPTRAASTEGVPPHALARQQLRSPKSLEGFWRTPPKPPKTAAPLPQQPVVKKQPAATLKPAAPAPSAPPILAQKKAKRRLQWLWMPLYAIAAMAGGFLIQSLFVGQLLLVGYAVFAWWRRIPSSTSFVIALITSGATVLFFTVQQNGQQAQNFAVYTFWIVVIGTISMILEIRRDQRVKRKINRGK